jgi:hypothetical protein
MQIEAKNAKGKKLSPEEDELKKEVDRLVDKAPCYFEGSSGNPIYSWQIKSLKKILAKKVCGCCVIWLSYSSVEGWAGNLAYGFLKPKLHLTMKMARPPGSVLEQFW